MYQVWTKDKFMDQWTLQEVDTVAEVEEMIRVWFSTDTEVKVTQEVPYEAKVAIKFREIGSTTKKLEPTPPEAKSEIEEVKSEADQSQPAPDKGTGDTSDVGDGRGDGGRVQKGRK